MDPVTRDQVVIGASTRLTREVFGGVQRQSMPPLHVQSTVSFGESEDPQPVRRPIHTGRLALPVCLRGLVEAPIILKCH